MQQHVLLALRVAQLEEELGLSGTGMDDLAQVCHDLFVELIRHHRDGDAVHSPFLHRLQQFNIAYLQLLLVVVIETRLHLAGDIDGRSFDELAVQVQPVVAEEHQLA